MMCKFFKIAFDMLCFTDRIKFAFSCLCVGNLLSGKLQSDESESYSGGSEGDTSSELSAGELSEEYHQDDIHKDEATAKNFLTSLQEDIEKGRAAKQQIGKRVRQDSYLMCSSLPRHYYIKPYPD